MAVLLLSTVHSLFCLIHALAQSECVELRRVIRVAIEQTSADVRDVGGGRVDGGTEHEANVDTFKSDSS